MTTDTARWQHKEYATTARARRHAQALLRKGFEVQRHHSFVSWRPKEKTRETSCKSATQPCPTEGGP